MPESRALYPELKITVQNDGSVEAVHEGNSADDGVISGDQLLRETIATFRDWLNRGKLQIEDERELQLLGKLLHNLLFGNGGPRIRQLIYNTVKAARDSNKPIRLQLAFKHRQAELASLPWEFLYDPDNKSFFAMANELILTRFVSGNESRQAMLCNNLPLRMLIVVCTKGGKSVAAGKTVEAIKAFADKFPERIILDGPMTDPTILDLQDWLEDVKNRPQIIHFIGHGQYNKSRNLGEIALAKIDDSGEADWVDQNRFTTMFKNSGCIPKFLFLQLCEGAVVKKGDLIASFEGLAPVLIEANVQAVVAMQFPIKNVHAGRISSRFYDELTKGRSVGEAVTAARRMAWTIDPVAGGTPVLYMYGYDGSIVSAPVSSAGGTPQSAAGQMLSGEYHARSGVQAEKSGMGEALPRSKPMRKETGGESGELTKLLDAGRKKIKDLTQSASLAQTIQPGDTTYELMSLNKKLYAEVIPNLVGKSLSETRLMLAVLLRHEGSTLFGSVIEVMFDESVKLSSPQLTRVVSAGIRKIAAMNPDGQPGELSEAQVMLNDKLHQEVIPDLQEMNAEEIKVKLVEYCEREADTPLFNVIEAMFVSSVS